MKPFHAAEGGADSEVADKVKALHAAESEADFEIEVNPLHSGGRRAEMTLASEFNGKLAPKERNSIIVGGHAWSMEPRSKRRSSLASLRKAPTVADGRSSVDDLALVVVGDMGGGGRSSLSGEL